VIGDCDGDAERAFWALYTREALTQLPVGSGPGGHRTVGQTLDDRDRRARRITATLLRPPPASGVRKIRN